jgi:hypothetical protein
VEDVEQIKQVVESFYKKLLGTNQLQFTATKADRVRHLIFVAISTDQAALLEKEITADEIKDTLFNMKTNKAPGPDGFPMEFFKSAWSVVGQDFIAAIKDFFVSSKLLTEVNATILTLVQRELILPLWVILGLLLAAMLFTNVSLRSLLIECFFF